MNLLIDSLTVCLILPVLVLFLIFSWYKQLARLPIIELAAIWMFASIMMQQCTAVIDYNLDLKNNSVQLPEVIVLKLNQILVFPAMMAWNSYFNASPAVTWMKRAVSYVLCAAVISVTMFLFKSMGYVHYNNWKGIYNFPLILCNILLIELFLLLLVRFPLRHEGGAP